MSEAMRPSPNIPGIEAVRALTHIEALELNDAPAHLIVLGGGYVGVEMAQAYRRFGSRVTIVEPGRQVMGREDTDVADEMRRILESEGIRILLGAAPVSVRGKSGDNVAVTVRTASGDQTIEGSDCWSGSAVSRTPPASASTRPASTSTHSASSV
jgi:pyruvate/2-oxoglutarate dehydrogenase complex dihydrolipoamide dehydrogenase (E3) component